MSLCNLLVEVRNANASLPKTETFVSPNAASTNKIELLVVRCLISDVLGSLRQICASRIMWSIRGAPRHLSIFIYLSSLLNFTSAISHDEDVYYCGVVLRDLTDYLASSFCSSFAGIEDVTSYGAGSPVTGLDLGPTCTETDFRETATWSSTFSGPTYNIVVSL
jgi:hypothetical protein